MNIMTNNTSLPSPPRPLSVEQLTQDWHGQDPLLSIVCTSFNHASFLESTLSGFFGQKTNFPFEVIIHDDASTDESPAIIERWRTEYPHIIRSIIQTENKFALGIAPSTLAFSLCRGKYIAFCEGDDYWTDPQKLQLQFEHLETNLTCALTFHASFSFQEGKVIEHGQYTRSITASELQKTFPIPTLTACFRNIPEFKNFPRDLRSSPITDACFWSLLGQHGHADFLSDIGPAAYRLHNNGIFSLVDQSKRNLMALKTYINLAGYYQKLNNDLYLYFINKSKKYIKKLSRNTAPWWRSIF